MGGKFRKEQTSLEAKRKQNDKEIRQENHQIQHGDCFPSTSWRLFQVSIPSHLRTRPQDIGTVKSIHAYLRGIYTPVSEAI